VKGAGWQGRKLGAAGLKRLPCFGWGRGDSMIDVFPAMSADGEEVDVMMTRSANIPRRRSGFTLLEALCATAILAGVVLSVVGAVTAGQQNAFEAQERIAGTLAAEELLGRLVVKPYAELASWQGYREEVGAMETATGEPMAETFKMVGRRVVVTTSLEQISDVGVRVRGRTVQVLAFDAQERTLADLRVFIPEPRE
jgi:Tfp pilus assembly protein PilV